MLAGNRGGGCSGHNDVAGAIVWVFLAAGCSSVPLPKPPLTPSPAPAQAFAWPNSPPENQYSYAPAPGTTAQITQSSVSITFTVFDPDLSAQTGEGLPSILVGTPTGAQVRLPAVGFSLRLDVTNATNHILRFERSVLAVEDQNQTPLKLFAGKWDQWRPGLDQRIHSFYQQYRDAINNWYQPQVTQQRRLVEPYTQDYARYVDAMRDYARPENHLSVQETVRGVDWATAKRQFDSTPTPAQMEAKLLAPVNAQRARLEAGVDSLEQQALQRARDLATPPTITEEDWPGLQLLPGRNLSAYLLFKEGLSLSSPREIRVTVFDLVTRVDAAANPVERATFRFKLVRSAPR
jgi:hypothetical protein